MPFAQTRTYAPEAAQNVIVRRLNRLSPLDSEGVALLMSLGGRLSHRPGAELQGERQLGVRPRLLVAGWAARIRTLPDGRRQILGFVLPGDPIGLARRPQPLVLANTVALTAVQTLDAAPVHSALAAGGERWASLARALQASSGLHEGYLLDQVMRLGRLTAYERMAHLLLELRDRLELAGLATAESFPMPLTQEMLADATGLSTVHVNRILQQLRRENMLELRAGTVTLLDPAALQAVCDYTRADPALWAG